MASFLQMQVSIIISTIIGLKILMKKIRPIIIIFLSIFLECMIEQQQKYLKFHVITAKDNKPIENSMIKATTSDGVMTGYTDAKGFVDLGQFFDGEHITIEVEKKML